MNVPELVQFANSREHLADVEPRMFLLKDARIVKQCPKVASGNIFHREVHMLCILKGIQQADQPWGFRRGEDVSLNEDVSDLGEPWSKAVDDYERRNARYLVHLEQRTFTHLL
jgi:hypothetical protein